MEKKKFINNLVKAKEVKGWTNEELGKAIGLSYNVIANALNGKNFKFHKDAYDKLASIVEGEDIETITTAGLSDETLQRIYEEKEQLLIKRVESLEHDKEKQQQIIDQLFAMLQKEQEKNQ